jgi:hypothetical protein
LVHPLDDILPGEARVLEAAEESLAGRRRGLRRAWPFLGPGFIASVAYIDPGNFATNMGVRSGLLAVGIVGATVMPHVIYLHSALTQHRIVGATEEAKRHIFRFELADVVVAMGTAGAINMSMLITAAAVFHSRSDRGGQPPDGRPRRAWHLPRKRRRPALWLWGAKTRSCVRAGALGLSEPIAWLALSIMGGVGAGIVAVRDVGAGDDARVAVLSLVGLQGA